MRIAIVTTIDWSLDAHYRGQLSFLREVGHEVVAVCSDTGLSDRVREREGVRVLNVPMVRGPAAWADVVSLVRLVRTLRRAQPDLVHYGTPKAGLLGALASTLLRVPHRVYVVHGLRFEGARGWTRRLLVAIERLIQSLSTDVVVVSPSALRKANDAGLFRHRGVVLGHGSINGIATDEYDRPGGVPATRDSEFRVVFVGRVMRDKGIDALVEGFVGALPFLGPARLLLVGPFEEPETLRPETRRQIRRNPAIESWGHLPDPTPVYALADLLVLPTWREGLPGVLLEGAASGIPILATRATGVIDVVRDDRFGYLVDIDDVEALRDALLSVRADPSGAGRRAASLLADVKTRFERRAVWTAWQEFYADRARSNGSEG